MPLSQLESMTIDYIPLFIVTYFFWWYKPEDIRSPSLVKLPDMSEEQIQVFESMAVSNKFDREGLKDQESYWNVWYLTPRVFEKEEEDRLTSESQGNLTQNPVKGPGQSPKQRQHLTSLVIESEVQLPQEQTKTRKDIVVAHWDPELYKTKLWPLI